ncbi:DUF2953 domain-containing protein [Vallitalea sp.]|jgi:hypothetical protein|uniref:DUF2953 domain-containing protein n=1 Tax=Vallitalea sp. TaxID=1882829 RepID=UPI0025E78630|nr:DUF2953 domain-containing protein [Vallitalea sp.]MCT4688160.1 DUF2953 domain-containing protein [Vallitalea sp.]
MLFILLGLLKIFLYIILFIILFVVLCILTILFVPIRYSTQGEKYDTIKLDVKVNWLLHIVSFKYHMDNDTKMSLKIFGKDIMAEKKHKKVKKVNNKKSRKKQKKKDIIVKSESKVDNVECNIKTKKDDLQGKKDEIKEDKNDKVNLGDKVNQKSEELNKNRVKKNNKIKEKKTKKKKKKDNKVNKDKATNSKWKQIYSTIKDFIKNEENRAVIKMIKDKVLKMIKHILPKKFQSKLIIGTGDPASTGYVVGVVSILYTVTGNKLKVVPDFNEKILQGCFYGKGKIYLIVLLKNTLSIILDKRVRKIYKTYKV